MASKELKELNMASKEPYVASKKTYAASKEPCTASKEPYTALKLPYIASNEHYRGGGGLEDTVIPCTGTSKGSKVQDLPQFSNLSLGEVEEGVEGDMSAVSGVCTVG